MKDYLQKKFYIRRETSERLERVRLRLEMYTRPSQSELINIALEKWLDGAEAGIRARENIEREIRENQINAKKDCS